MPVMDGREFLEHYERFAQGIDKTIKIIVLTASPNPDHEKRSAEFKSVVKFVNKPLDKARIEEFMHVL